MLNFSKRNKAAIPILLLGLLILSWISPFTAFASTDPDEDELFLVAQKAFEDGFYDVAIRYIDQFLQKYPQTDKRIQAQLLLGQCYFFKSQYLKAFDIFQGLTQFAEFKDATLFWLGETYFKGSDYKQAKDHYQQLINLYPDSIYLPQAYYSLGWTHFEEADYVQAKKIFRKLIQKFPVHQLSEDAIFKLGESEHNLGSYEVATQYFRNYISKYPQSPRHAQAYFYIAEGYYYMEDHLTAITYYAKAADIAYDPKIAIMANVSLGWSYFKLEKYELSKNYFAAAQKLSEEKNIPSDDIYLGQASLFAEMQEHSQALEAYTKLIEQFPNSPRIAESHLGKANIHYILKNYNDALNEYQWIIDTFSAAPQREEIVEKAYYGMAWTYLKSGNIDQSIAHFEKIMNSTESKIVKISTLTQIGDAYQDVDQLQKAIEVYDRVLKDYPESIYADYVQFRQGVALLKLNKLEAATLSFQSLQANFPQSKYITDVEYYLGVTYFKKEDWLQAVVHINNYLNRLETYTSLTFTSESYYILAQSHFQLENYAEALGVFKKILNDFPEQKTMMRIARLNIAKCHYNLEQVPAALTEFQEIIAQYPKSEAAQEALLWLGDHHLDQGEFENSIQYYQTFIKKFPGSDKVGVVHYELGQAFQALDQLDEALNHYKLIEKSAGKAIYAKAKLAIADIFSQDLDQQNAIHTYLQIAESSPDFKRNAFVKMAGIHEGNREYKKAIDAYRQALSSEKALSELDDAQLQFYIGDTYEILNNSDKAVEAYLKIPYLYSQETLWVIKSYLRVARIFEDSEQWHKAKAIYDKILDFKTEESKHAKERINWINENIL